MKKTAIELEQKKNNHMSCKAKRNLKEQFLLWCFPFTLDRQEESGAAWQYLRIHTGAAPTKG